jgi:hypothetical protein
MKQVLARGWFIFDVMPLEMRQQPRWHPVQQLCGLTMRGRFPYTS